MMQPQDLRPAGRGDQLCLLTRSFSDPQPMTLLLGTEAIECHVAAAAVIRPQTATTSAGPYL